MVPLLIIGAAMAAQAPAQADGQFSMAEIRTMCRGESDEPAQFRTEAAFRLLADIQRNKCRMYLLGIADGIGRGGGQGDRCPSQGPDRETQTDRMVAAILSDAPDPGRAASAPVQQRPGREALADRLVAAVLSESRDAGQSIPGLVQRVLGAESGCP